MNKYEEKIKELIENSETLYLIFIETNNTNIYLEIEYYCGYDEEEFYDDIYNVAYTTSTLCEHGYNWQFDINVEDEYGNCTIFF